MTAETRLAYLVGRYPAASHAFLLREAAQRSLGADLPSKAPQIPLWDGKAGPRAAAAIEAFLAG